MEIKVERNVPMPIKRGYGKWPFATMKVGDSFAFAGDKLNQVHQAASQYRRRANPSWRFTVRKQVDGYRIWRIK
jgi:hypothetical protein